MSQNLAIVLRYLDHDRKRVVDALLDSVEADDTTCSVLYKALKDLQKLTISRFQILLGLQGKIAMLGWV